MRWFGLAIVVTCIGTSALAQTAVTDDLTPSVQPEHYRICNDRPERPAWIDTIHPREAYKALTLMGLYELRSWQSMVAREDCTCEVRFPDWAEASEEYTARFATMSAPDHTRAQRDLRRQKSDLRREVQILCEAQGNW